VRHYRFRLRVFSFATVLVSALASADLTVAQSLPATGGFVEPAPSLASRGAVTAAEAAPLLPTRGRFTFPSPYNTTAFRLTTAADCGGQDCVRPVGYSYWNNINNHAGSDTMLIFLGLDRRVGGSGPTLFTIDKRTGETRNAGPLFAAGSPHSWNSGEGWYFSGTRPHALYMHSGARLLRYDVQTRAFETVLDVTSQFGASRYIWQAHSSHDDRVHSATLRDGSTYAMLGCVAYREDTGQWYFAPRIGDYDECQIDKSGRWLVIKENVDGRYGEDNRIIDLQTGTERVLLDENGAVGHSDVGFGYMVGADNWNPQPGAIRTWTFDKDVRGGEPLASVAGQGTLAYQLPSWAGSVGHVAHGNARPGVGPDRQIACNSSASRQGSPRVNEIVCYRLDGSLDALVVAPNLTDLDAAGGGSQEYNKLPKGNLDPTGEYFIWTSNAGTGRLDAFIVRVPAALLDPAPEWEPVRWVDLVNAAAASGTLQKTAGCGGCADAGAASEQQIASGDGALKFTAAEAATSRIVGLSAGNSGTTAAEIQFGIRLWPGMAEVRESGVYRKDIRYVAGDRFEVRVEGGVVRYLKNDIVFHTSTRPPQYPLLVDASLSTVGATLTHVMIKRGS
jgi:hypothetical protein